MSLLFRVLSGSLLCLAAMQSSQLQAHAEHDKARFVAVDGSDQGDCSDVFRPCASIRFAVNKANKGDRVLVAAGGYEVAADDYFYLTSTTVPVLGGYNRFEHYQQQNPAVNRTRLVGVPQSLAADLARQGFQIIVDTKASQQSLQRLQKKIAAHADVTRAQRQLSCDNGQAGAFSCRNIDLIAHLPLGDFSVPASGGNDVWGHHDLNSGKEYALMGLTGGVAVIDVSDPAQPREISLISGTAAGWRDIKTYQFYDDTLQRWRAYAYATSDKRGNQQEEGLMIIDLNNLPHSASLVRFDTQDMSAHNVYISGVDYSTGVALPGSEARMQILGQSRFGGAFRSYSLADPKAPATTFQQSQATRNDYTHDAASLPISDARKDSQCVNAANLAACEVLLDFNENEMRLWDISLAGDSRRLSSTSYTGAAYTHSGWWSEDKRYVLLHDEADETRSGSNTTVRIFEIDDLTNPQLISTWVGTTRAIDHNGFVRGNRYYMSTYTRGLTVLDISDPAQPEEVGFFDTHPNSDNANFDGAWGVYPYLPSGNILVSDISGGLFILKDNTQSTSRGSLAFAEQRPAAVAEGESLTITVQRLLGSEGAVDVGFETFEGSAGSQDFTARRGRLSWADGDSSAKTISIALTADGDDGELSESLFVRLFDPTNGATLSTPNLARLTIAGQQRFGSVLPGADSIELREGIDSEFSLPLQRLHGSEGQITLNASLVNAGQLNGQLTLAEPQLSWADGDAAPQSVTLRLAANETNQGDQQVLLRLQQLNAGNVAASADLTVTVRDDEANQPPVVNAGGNFQVNPLQVVALSGQVSDPENRPTTARWRQVSGPAVNLVNSQTLNASFTAPGQAATLIFELEGQDDFAVAAKAQITVQVQATNSGSGSSGGGGGGSTHPGWLLLLAVAMWHHRQQAGKS